MYWERVEFLREMQHLEMDTNGQNRLSDRIWNTLYLIILKMNSFS